MTHRLQSAITLNNQGISALINDNKKNGSGTHHHHHHHHEEQALQCFTRSIVVLQELLIVCNNKASSSSNSMEANTYTDTTDAPSLPPISVDVTSLPFHPTGGNELRKVVAFDTNESDETVQMDALQIFSSSVIYNISLCYHIQSHRVLVDINNNSEDELTHNQNKAQVLYEKACLCVPQHNKYQMYALMLRALAIHNLGILCKEVGCFDKAHDCIRAVRDMVLSTGEVLPQMLSIDGDEFIESTSMFMIDILIDESLPPASAAAA